MPNGIDKNWIRLCAAVNGYRSTFGKWPTRIRMIPACLTDLREHILTAEGFAQVESRIELVPETGATMIAEGDDGTQYNYGEQGFPETRPDVTAVEWFDNPSLRPEAYDV